MTFMLPPPQTGLERRRSSLIQAYNRPPAPNPIWTGGFQPQEKSRAGTVAKFGGTLIGLTTLGFAPVGKKRVWDYYLKAIRVAEEVSPAKILRTFQYSELLSPLASNRGFSFPAELFSYTYEKAGATITAPNRAMRRFVSNMLGKPIAQLEELGAFSKGLEFRRTGWIFGELSVKGGQLLSNAALPMRAGTHAGGSFIDWYARLSGIKLGITEGVTRTSSGGMMAISVPKVDKVLGIPISEIAQVHLQKARVTGRIARAYAAGQMGRLNRLLAAPADWFPSLGKLTEKMGISFTVKSGSALQTLGRYTAKGLALAGAFKSFQYLSHRRGESDNKLLSGAGFAALGGALGGIFRSTKRGVAIGAALGGLAGIAPLFDKGITEGVATGYIRTAMGYSRMSESTGLTASRREQEEFMPGITKARTLLGFTTGGMMTGLLAGYGLKLAKFKRMGIKGASEFMEQQAQAIKARSAATKASQPGLIGKAKAWLGRKMGAGAKGLKNRALMRGGWAGALFGAAAFGALAIGAAWATGNVLPGIVGSEHTPEELEGLYTGREDVAIRRGRWWEFGRCLNKSCSCKLFDGKEKIAEEIEVGDILVGSGYEPAKVLGVYKRHHTGSMFKFYTAYDRDIATEITGNHIVPSLERLNTNIREVKASDLKTGDWVETPYKQYSSIYNRLDLIDYLDNHTIVIHKDRIYSGQKNWFTKKMQRSGTHSLPHVIDLNEDFGRLVGYFLAEGNLSYSDKINKIPHMIETVHAKSEDWIVKDIIAITRNIFGTTPTVRFKTTGKKTKEGCWIVRICSSILAKLFYNLFYATGDKDIPEVFLSSSVSFKKGLIEGYWRGDGHWDKKTKVISSSRKWLLEKTQLIALSIGKICGIGKKEENDYRGRWKLRFYSNALCSGMKIHNERLFSRIKAIEEEDYNDIVYDFTVITDDHLFQAGTFLVHNSPWEGGRIAYYRPHWYRMLMSKARVKGLWGSEQKKWEASPMLHPLKALFDDEFKYRWERENYAKRPYPMTGTYGSDIPFVAPIAEAIGQLIKPSKLMHTDEWLRGPGLESAAAGQGAVLHVPTSGDHEPAYGLGGLGKGTPVSKFAPKQQLGELIYRFNELRGLTGFLHGAVKESLTGSQDYFDKMEQLETANRAYGAERAYWDKELGGLLGMCFVAGTPIKTSMGTKNIEDICIGDMVLSKNQYRRVLHQLQRAVSADKNILVLSSKSAGVSLTCTDNHWIPIIRRHTYKKGHKKPFNNKNISLLEIQAKEIKKGDYFLYQIDKIEKDHIIDLDGTGKCSTEHYIYKRASLEYAQAYEIIEHDASKAIFPRNISRADLRELGFKDSVAKEVFYSFWHGIKPDRIDRYIFVTEDIAYVIGWYLAEGCQDGAQLRYTMHSNEEQYANKILDIFGKLGFNGNIKIQDNTLVLKIYSSQLARYFSIFGDGAHNKHIPIEFKQLPKLQLEKLIKGLVLGDGWTEGFTSVSKQLTKDLFDCYLKLGQHVNLYLDYVEKGNGFYPQGTPRYNTKRHYLRLTQGRYNWRFLDETTYLVPVSQIETKISIGETVYDLTIEDVHYYTADGILVHNTEAFRRFLPHRRRQIDLYNPIKNLMPEWLPGPDYYVDFQHGDPFCVSENTLIEVDGNRLIFAKDVSNGDIIKTHTGNLMPVVKKNKRKIKQDEKCFEIQVAGIDPKVSVQVSEEHPILSMPIYKCTFGSSCICRPDVRNHNGFCDSKNCTQKWNRDRLNFVEAQELKVGDIVAYPVTIHSDIQSITYKFDFYNAPRSKPSVIQNTVLLDENLAWLLGVYAAEGSTGKQNGRPMQLIFSLHANENQFADKIEELISILFKAKGRRNYRGNSLDIVYSNAKLARIFNSFMPGNLYSKSIPSELFKSPPNVVFAFLAGIIEGDGSLYRNQIVVSLANKNLIQQCFILANSNGIPAGYKERNTRDAYELHIHSFHLRNFKINDWLIEKKPNIAFTRQPNVLSWSDQKYIYRIITAIRVIDLEEVYGFEVDINDSFCVIGAATHNTKVQEGDVRLPGEGYAALHPEVAGLDPSDYPLEHRFKILADVAMYSNQFKETRREMRGAVRRNELSKSQIELFDRVNRQVSEKKKRKRFNEYRFTKDVLEQRQVTVAGILPGGLIQTKEQGIIGFGGVNIRAERGTETYRHKQAQVSDFLREHVQPGAELDIFVHRDPLHRFKKDEAGYYQPAVMEMGGRNLSKRLVDADIMRFTKGEDPFAVRSKYNVAQRALGSLWENIVHYESPREYLLPLSPKAKFLHQRSAIEEYERSRVWGTESAFWQHPIKHFIEPTLGMVAREWGGTEEIPEHVRKRRAIEDYFDKLKWVKYKALERTAISSEDPEAAKEFRGQQRRTLFGVDPYGSQSYIYSAMPSLDRDYYEEFKKANTQEERATIMKMIAPNQRKLYMAQWRNQLTQALKAKVSMGLEDGSTEAVLGSLNAFRSVEGRDVSPQLRGQYKEEAEPGESYADWSRRKEAADYFKGETPLPGANWVGWHPHVDLEDVKLKIVDNLGEDAHDYNLWESRQRELVRKPYITDQPMTAETRHPSELTKSIESVLRDVLRLKDVQVQVIPAPAGQDEVQLEIADGRETALQVYKSNPEFQEMM